ncbi:hypothetical protein [Exiguobacterium sp. s95]|uniref:hypothetical protein n=1 Tax=Exiguobacterium sp. s95 TaxID=2751211 RepID=UPI001BECD322|nr:hypothetical protein [Exiguobacterium sp. s95]
MKKLKNVPTFKEILMEKRRELIGTSLVVIIILIQITTQLVNFLKKDEVHGLYTYTYTMNVQGIILLIAPATVISLLIIKGLYMVTSKFPQLMSIRQPQTASPPLIDSNTSLQTFTGNSVLDEMKHIKSVMETFNECNNYVLNLINYKVFKSKVFNIILGTLFYVICSILLRVPPFSYLFAMFDPSLIQWVIIIATVFVTLKGKDFLNQFLIKKRIARNEATFKQRSHLRNEAAKYLREQQLVPEHYLHLDAINQMIGYMSNKRALTVRKAINLYENDEHVKQ